jgi:asparagine N-glycosylation enzyme membrane subunit Stt3
MASGKSSELPRRLLIPLATFAVALSLRLIHRPPELAPLDELYHWKRMAYSAAHFPAVLEFDLDRGERGAFCPWPPLYDLASGGIARLFGLDAVRWIPPIGYAIFAALAALWIERRFGTTAAIAAAVAIASTPFILELSSYGNIDHHWLEPALVFAILATAIERDDWLLGAAITCAMFVQTALLVAAALAFVVVFVERRRSAAISFAVAAITIALYRATRGPGFPDSAWFLGWTHAALFAGAAVALLIRRRALAIAAGAAVVLVTPSALPALLTGSHFFGGDRWLATISEFQPLWKGQLDDYLSFAAGLGAGALLVWPLALRAWRARDRTRLTLTLALFAIVYLALTISSRRFWTAAVPLLALAGAVYASTIERRTWRMLALLAVAVPPPLQLAIWMQHPTPRVSEQQRPWVRAAEWLRTQPPGRVLAPWSYGHLFDVTGAHAVVVDNFGSMPGAAEFERAYAALTSREERLAAYCRRNRVRYVVLEPPAPGLASAGAILGIPIHSRDTWWSQAWFTHRSKRFALIRSEPALMIWQLRDDVR